MTAALVDECTLIRALYCRLYREDKVGAVVIEAPSMIIPEVEVVQSDNENEREFDLRDDSDDKYESESDDKIPSLVPRTEHYDNDCTDNESVR